ncbi:MAG TPA: hypothetical protein DCO79_16050 [Spirochaeta sp.]|nr:hypothetical protein [Spirochaeta sp.]
MEYQLKAAVTEDAEWVNELTYNTMRPWVEESWPSETDQRHYYELNIFDLSDIHLAPAFHGNGQEN